MTWRINGGAWQDGEATAFQRTMPSYEVRQDAVSIGDALPCIVCEAPSDTSPVCDACWDTIPGFVPTSIEEWIMNGGAILRSERDRDKSWASRETPKNLGWYRVFKPASYIRLLHANARGETAEVSFDAPSILDEDGFE